MKQKYTYKNKEYYIKEKVLLKNPHTREWQKAVIYCQIGLDLVFCREKEEFERLFKRDGYLTE